MSQFHSPLLRVAAVGAMLVLSPMIEQTWNVFFLLPLTGVSAQPAATGHNQAGQTRTGAAAGGHQEHAAETPPPLTENVMTVSPERLQAIGVKFELAKRRSLDRTIRTVEIGRASCRERV